MKRVGQWRNNRIKRVAASKLMDRFQQEEMMRNQRQV